jgi:Flp pilus assembly protein TadG
VGAFRRRDERGAAAVEFALVMVPLLMIVFGIIQYAVYFWAMQGGADAARHAARMAAVGKPSACTDFENEAADAISIFGASNVDAKRTYTKGSGNTLATREIGDEVTVTVTFDSMDFNLPFVPFIEDGQVSSTAKARVDYTPDINIGNCA